MNTAQIPAYVNSPNVQHDISEDTEKADSNEDQDEAEGNDESNYGYGAEQAKITESEYVGCVLSETFMHFLQQMGCGMHLLG